MNCFKHKTNPLVTRTGELIFESKLGYLISEKGFENYLTKSNYQMVSLSEKEQFVDLRISELVSGSYKTDDLVDWLEKVYDAGVRDGIKH